MHPGAVKSNSGQENGKVYKWYRKKIIDKKLKSTDIAAEALYFLGVSREVDEISGKFFNLTKQEITTPPSRDKEVAKLLWEKSIEMGGLRK